MTELNKAQSKYKDYLRSYNTYKDVVDEFYMVHLDHKPKKISKAEAKYAETKMNHCFDVMETLLYIFGKEVQQWKALEFNI